MYMADDVSYSLGFAAQARVTTSALCLMCGCERWVWDLPLRVAVSIMGFLIAWNYGEFCIFYNTILKPNKYIDS